MLTFKDLIQNPSGKGSAHVASRQMISDTMKQKFKIIAPLIKRGNAGIVNDTAWAHIKIPSESVLGVYFDVVLSFPDISTNVLDAPVRVFSNCPSFTFTYAYVIENEGMLIPEMRKLYSKEAITTPPDIRNSNKEMGFEKSITFALLYLQQFNLHHGRKLFELIGRNKINLANMFKDIPSAVAKLAEYNNEKAKQSKKERAIKTIQKMTSWNQDNQIGGNTKRTSTVKTTPMAKQVKSAPMAKRAKIAKAK